MFYRNAYLFYGKAGGIGVVKLTVGVRRRTQEKVQYCITTISNK